MLTADQYDDLIGPVMELYQRFEDSVLADIARRLANYPMTATAAHQAQRLAESGMMFEEIVERISKLTGQSESVLREVLTRAGVRAMRFDDSVYRAVGLDPLPLNLSPAMASILAETVQRTNATMRNLTLTTASAGQDAFVMAADNAYMQVAHGTMSYQQAVREAVKNIAAQGLSVIQYGGRRDQLDVATRRAVLTSVGQMANQLTLTRAEEMGVDLVQTSAHAGARPSHLLWQGKVFSVSGASREYPPLVESTGYGTAGGLAGINCRHSMYPFFEGISENAYKQATLDEFAGRQVTYNGKRLDFYDATQQQRGIERAIRKAKREAAALDAARIDNAPELAQVRALQAQMRDFIGQTGLVRQRTREQVPGV